MELTFFENDKIFSWYKVLYFKNENRNHELCKLPYHLQTNTEEPNQRSSLSQIFFRIGALKNFAIFTTKHLRWCLDSEYCKIFRNNLFYRTSPVAAFKITA